MRSPPFCPPDDRLVLIEDTAELQLEASNLVRFEARREQVGLPAVTIRDLLRATLRHRPDRILLGEVRGGEAFDFLQALNTGHSGTLSTIHANSAEQALTRFASCVIQSGVDVPYQAVRLGDRGMPAAARASRAASRSARGAAGGARASVRRGR